MYYNNLKSYEGMTTSRKHQRRVIWYVKIASLTECNSDHPFQPFSVQYQLLMSDTFNIDYNPQVVDSSSTNYHTPFFDTAYSYHTNDPAPAPGIFSLTPEYTVTSAGRNDATFASSEFETAPAYPSTTTYDFTYEATNFANYASTSAALYTAALPNANQGHFQQPQTSVSSFASRWGGYQDLERDNDVSPARLTLRLNGK
jgi:hypothetical protein